MEKKNVFFMGDNIACLTLIRGFEKNFMNLKHFFLRNIKKRLRFGFLLENFLFSPTNLNVSDCLTRLEGMVPANLTTFLGDF